MYIYIYVLYIYEPKQCWVRLSHPGTTRAVLDSETMAVHDLPRARPVVPDRNLS